MALLCHLALEQDGRTEEVEEPGVIYHLFYILEVIVIKSAMKTDQLVEI
jgi:hypothetical protein